MKRSIFMVAAAALALGGCSGSKKEGEAEKPAAAKPVAKKGGKEEPHVNPWAKDAPEANPAPAPAKEKAAAKGKEEAKVNPWAKDPPPGSAPSEPAKDAKK